MEEKLNEVENMEESVDLEVGLNTDIEPEETNDMHTVVCYDEDDEDEDEEDSENGVGKIIVGGLLVGSFLLGSWAGPKIKKGAVDGFNWVKSKFSKKESEEVISEVVEPEK